MNVRWLVRNLLKMSDVGKFCQSSKFFTWITRRGFGHTTLQNATEPAGATIQRSQKILIVRKYCKRCLFRYPGTPPGGVITPVRFLYSVGATIRLTIFISIFWCHLTTSSSTVEKYDQPSEWNASALVQKKQNYYYSLLYTRNKG